MIIWVHGWKPHWNSTQNSMASHQTVIVKKPWGYEYLAYQNANVALWVLHITQEHSTSMHCHPTKSTGLVVVGGTAEINFIADKRQLVAPDKQMIRRGLFHQTRAVTDVIMLEVETPVDKNDLVRLKDTYGRTDSAYEGAQFELPKSNNCIWVETPGEYVLGDSQLTVERVTELDILEQKNNTDIIMFLDGGLIKTVEGRTHLVTRPGDVGLVQVVKQVAKEMDGWAPNTIIMTIKKND